MKLVWILVALLLAYSHVAQAKSVPPGPVKHFVALMMENRAYDHMLGFLDLKEHHQGLSGKEYNHWDPQNSGSRKVFVSSDAKDVRFFLWLYFHLWYHLKHLSSVHVLPHLV